MAIPRGAPRGGRARVASAAAGAPRRQLQRGASRARIPRPSPDVAPQRYTTNLPAGAAVDLHLLVEGQLGACWAFSIGRVRLGPCAVIGLGALSVAGRNVKDPKTSTIAVLHGGPGLRATVPLGSWFELSAGLFGRATARPQVAFEGFPTVVEGFWAAAEAFVGAGGAF